MERVELRLPRLSYLGSCFSGTSHNSAAQRESGHPSRSPPVEVDRGSYNRDRYTIITQSVRGSSFKGVWSLAVGPLPLCLVSDSVKVGCSYCTSTTHPTSHEPFPRAPELIKRLCLDIPESNHTPRPALHQPKHKRARMTTCSAMARPASLRPSGQPTTLAGASTGAQVTNLSMTTRCIPAPLYSSASSCRVGRAHRKSQHPALALSATNPASLAESAAAVFGGAFNGRPAWQSLPRPVESSTDAQHHQPHASSTPPPPAELAGTVSTSAGGLTSPTQAKQRQQQRSPEQSPDATPVSLATLATELATAKPGACCSSQQQSPASQRPATDAEESSAAEPFSLGWRPFDRNRYKTLNVLGSGGYGTVYLAEDVETGEQVAVKRIPKSRKRSPPEKVKRNLVKEAGLLEMMQFSPGVIGITDKYEDDRNAYLVMEYVQGGSLEEYVHRHRRDLTEAELSAIARNVFEFLSDCHAVDIVFADVKPANFMMASTEPGDLTLKAIDFGCSQFKVAGEGLTTRTGTFKYFAPEVFKQNYGTAADNWSMGIMMFRIMSGSYPWWSPSRNLSPTEAMEDVCSDEPVPFDQSHWKRYSPAAQSFVKALLEKDSTKRLTADEALVHPWLLHYKDAKAASGSDDSAVSNILPLRLQPHSVPINVM